jgi:glycosyltransferase involved in cell wall biosynthesis
MNVLFLSISQAVSNINNRGIYPDLLRKFATEGHKVFIVCPFERKLRKKTEYSISNNVHTLGVKTLNITKTNIIEKGIGTLLIERQFKNAINKYFSNEQFDLILYSTPPITFSNLITFLKKKHNAKSYLLLKDIFPQNAVDLGLIKANSLLHNFFKKKEKQLYKISDHIGCMSPANVNYLIQNNSDLSKNCIEICPNSIELKTKNSETLLDKINILNKYNIPSNTILIIYGGNLGKPQGIDFLIQILKTNSTNKKIYFIIAGNGTEYIKLKKWLLENQLTNTTLFSSLPKDEFDLLVGISDISLILLNYQFTIPNYPSRLLTYLEYKKPILVASDKASDVGKIAIENNYGFSSSSNNINEFNKNLNLLIENEDLRISMGQNGYDYLKNNYTVQNSYEIIMNHFK